MGSATPATTLRKWFFGFAPRLVLATSLRPFDPLPMTPSLRHFALSLLVASAAFAAEPAFPGLRAIMSAEAWQQARLDRLDAADLQLIDAAFAQYLQARQAPAATPAVAAQPAAEPAAEKPARWTRFGLGKSVEKTPEARELMKARVTALRGSNGFELDNGQVWAGIDLIRVDLLGREIAVQEGRLGSFLLIVDGRDTNVRLRRVK